MDRNSLSLHFFKHFAGIGTSCGRQVSKRNETTFAICEFYLYKIYLIIKKNVDLGNKIKKDARIVYGICYK